MFNFCDFIQVFVSTTNHILILSCLSCCLERPSTKIMSQEMHKITFHVEI